MLKLNSKVKVMGNTIEGKFFNKGKIGFVSNIEGDNIEVTLFQGIANFTEDKLKEV